jgi:hypothetical protein
LEEHRYLGDYSLDATGVCYRTQVALRATFTPARKMEQFLAGTWDGELDDGRLRLKGLSVLGQFREEIEKKLGELRGLGKGAEVEVLMMRWGQMAGMADETLKNS